MIVKETAFSQEWLDLATDILGMKCVEAGTERSSDGSYEFWITYENKSGEETTATMRTDNFPSWAQFAKFFNRVYLAEKK